MGFTAGTVKYDHADGWIAYVDIVTGDDQPTPTATANREYKQSWDWSINPPLDG